MVTATSSPFTSLAPTAKSTKGSTSTVIATAKKGAIGDMTAADGVVRDAVDAVAASSSGENYAMVVSATVLAAAAYVAGLC